MMRPSPALFLALALATCSDPIQPPAPDGPARHDAAPAPDLSKSKPDASLHDATGPTPDAALHDATGPKPDMGKSTPDAALHDATGPKPDAGKPPPLLIYMAPAGKDANDGSSPAKAILTLGRAQQLIAAMKTHREVQIHIAPGTYRGQKVVWTHTMPAHKIRFMPQGGGKTRPVFDGCIAPGSCPGGTWLILKHSKGQKTNLHFDYIQVQNYHTAISLNGDRNAANTSNSHNRIYGCYFANIGNVFNPKLNPSTAAVRLVNSDDNLIANNHFVDIINKSSAGLLHAIYAAHLSDRNKILRNRFKNNSGDPVRLRDFSNYNIINENKFIKSGIYAGYTDWYCNHDIYTNCTKKGPECASWENQFRDNLLDGTYACAKLGTFKYFQGDKAKGCSPPKAGAKRLYTSGNKYTAKPCTS